MSLPDQLLLSDLLRRRVRCQAGIDYGPGAMAWMHPPVHRLLGWISKPSAFGDRREAWRLNQLRGLAELEALSGAAKGGGRWGTGGMTTKLAAARIATASGIQVRLADGRDPRVLEQLLAGEAVGTLFRASDTPLSNRKGWLAHALVPKGSITVDAGAERALLRQGASLLATIRCGCSASMAVNWPAASAPWTAASCSAAKGSGAWWCTAISWC